MAKRYIKKGESGVFLTKRGIFLHFRYGYDGMIECWVNKEVRKTGGWRIESFMRNPTKELIDAFEWEQQTEKKQEKFSDEGLDKLIADAIDRSHQTQPKTEPLKDYVKE